MRKRACASALLVGLLAVAPPARGQDRFAESPTTGLSLPATPLAGDQDATAIALNPAGLVFLGGMHLELALTGLDPAHAEGAGSGVGLYWARPIDVPLLPRMAFGLAVEQLFPPGEHLVPDPGEPLALSMPFAVAAGRTLGYGVTWRHFLDDGPLAGVDTFDVGLSLRLGARWAGGLVLRDVGAPVVAGVPVQRRLAGELVWRPGGSDRFELGLGADSGLRRDGDGAARLRLAWRLTDGLKLRAEGGMRTRLELDDPALMAGPTTRRYEARASIGLEVSFGGVGATLYGTGGSDAGGDLRPLGGSVVLRWSGERLPSLVGPGPHLVRIELKGSIGERGLTRLATRLRRLERDGDVKGVVLVVNGLTDGWATLEEVRDGIHRLRGKGKKVFAYLVAGGTRDYFVAAAADKIYLDPSGGLRLVGMSSTVLYFKHLFDDLGVLAQFEKIEEYKSAPEAFTRDAATEEARRMRDWLLDGVYGRVVAGIARDRGLSEAEVRDFVEHGPYTAGELAGKKGLVDAVAEPPKVDEAIDKEMGGGIGVLAAAEAERPPVWEYPQVAVVYIDGDIVDGKSMTVPLLGTKLVGGDTIAAAIAYARSSPRVKAIVLRIDSPGGSALASEVIAREVKNTQGKKPIVVSMGDVAASGGYFAAAYGDTIYAEPSTITGSIGIFTGKFDLSGLLGRAGLTWETSVRGGHADMESYFRPYTDEERATIKDKLRYYYGRFVLAVSEGRQMSKDEVDKVGRGQVWTGSQAMERRLVDKFGGVADAIVEAKRRAGLGDGDRAELLMLPAEPASVVSQLLRLAGGGDSEARAGERALLSPFAAALRAIPGSLLLGPGIPQARLPFAIELE